MPYLANQYWEEAGRGPALVLLHGHTLDQRMWADHREVLAQHFRVITPDLPNHGRSGPAPGGRPFGHLIMELLDHLGLEKAALCGLSLGGAVAISFALHHPSRCAALVPVDAALYGHPFSSWPGPKPYVKLARSAGLEPALRAWLADPLFAAAMASPAAERITEIVLAYPGGEWLTSQPLPMPPGGPEAERLGEISAPTLVMVGEHDLSDFHAIADRLTTTIPQALKVVVPGAGHMLPMERPRAFQQQLIPFLSEQIDQSEAFAAWR